MVAPEILCIDPIRKKKNRKEEGIQILVKCKPKSWYLGLVIVNKMVFRWKPSSRLQIHICADVQTLVSFFFLKDTTEFFWFVRTLNNEVSCTVYREWERENIQQAEICWLTLHDNSFKMKGRQHKLKQP